MSDGVGTDEAVPAWIRDERVQQALVMAQQVAQWDEDRLSNLELHASEPDHMSVVSFTVVQEHQRAAVVLVRHGLLASATALMRPAFEAFVRGLWLQWANDHELAHFQRGHDTSTPEKIIRKVVERSGVHRYADLLDTWKQSQKTMHGYVHHGYQSLIRRSGVVPISPEEVVDLLGFSTSMALHAAFEVLELAGKRVPESEVETRPQLVYTLQLQVLGMLRMMGLVQVVGEDRAGSPASATGTP